MNYYSGKGWTAFKLGLDIDELEIDDVGAISTDQISQFFVIGSRAPKGWANRTEYKKCIQEGYQPSLDDIFLEELIDSCDP